MALADVYDALRSRRPYKNPWNHESARRLIVGELGTHFDPAVVNAFQIAEDDIEGIYEDNLENGAEMRE
ncbi:MAG: Cyclic di-GMP phosphodiesterase response regulator RpfG [candidate division BRC1 bacterium ADurb.BinA364]|nr:MAG: Cyclic di-GMP phosphodiesterase response regulator RpfG [candidate division BRC1 bacterium ADurb.BinA364]